MTRTWNVCRWLIHIQRDQSQYIQWKYRYSIGFDIEYTFTRNSHHHMFRCVSVAFQNSWCELHSFRLLVTTLQKVGVWSHLRSCCFQFIGQSLFISKRRRFWSDIMNEIDFAFSLFDAIISRERREEKKQQLRNSINKLSTVRISCDN